MDKPNIGIEKAQIDNLSLETLRIWSEKIYTSFCKGLIPEEKHTDVAYLNYLVNKAIKEKSNTCKCAELDKLSSKFEVNIEKQVEVKLISKNNSEDLRIAFGVVMEPMETDAHSEFARAVEIEREAHQWLATRQKRKLMHNFDADGDIEIYESYITKSDQTIEGEFVKKGSWLMMVHFSSDSIWESVKKGDLTGFSIGGTAEVVDV